MHLLQGPPGSVRLATVELLLGNIECLLEGVNLVLKIAEDFRLATVLRTLFGILFAQIGTGKFASERTYLRVRIDSDLDSIPRDSQNLHL